MSFLNEVLANQEPDSIKVLREIVKNHSFKYLNIKTYEEVSKKKPGAVLMDVTTANAICTVYDNLSASNQEKFSKMPLDKMGSVAFKLLSK